jgi:hypothetical protein
MKFDNIKYEPMDYKVKWFLPLSDTKKYEMLTGFLDFFAEAKKGKTEYANHRKPSRNIQGIEQTRS